MNLGNLLGGAAIARSLLPQALQLHAILVALAFELGDRQIDVGALELGQLLAGGDLLARLHVERTSLPVTRSDR